MGRFVHGKRKRILFRNTYVNIMQRRRHQADVDLACVQLFHRLPKQMIGNIRHAQGVQQGVVGKGQSAAVPAKTIIRHKKFLFPSNHLIAGICAGRAMPFARRPCPGYPCRRFLMDKMFFPSLYA